MMNFVKTAVILGVVEMVRDFQFPSAELKNTERVQRTSHQKELSRQGRSLHQDLFLSREPRSEDDQEDEEVLMSPPPSFSRILEHSLEPEYGEGSICSSTFAPGICLCSPGLITRAIFCLIDFNFELIFSLQLRFLVLVLQTFDVLFLI